MVSLKDIAQRCGVSTATVSKALHDRKDIGAETKNRIKKIAKEMGYLPNAAAEFLRQKSRTTSEYCISMRRRWDLRMSILPEC